MAISSFEVVRPPADSDFSGGVNVDDLVPDDDWLWGSLQWYCVSECCGLDAYEFSETAVRHALGQDVRLPRRITPGRGQPDNVPALIDDLATASDLIREMDATLVTTTQLNGYISPTTMADLLEYLADTLRLAWDGGTDAPADRTADAAS